MLVFDSKHFLTSSNLIYDNGYLWKTEVPEQAMTMEGVRSFDHFSKLFGYEVDPLIPKRYRESAKVLGTEPPWCFYIGKTKFQKMIDEYVEQHDKVLSSLPASALDVHTKINVFIDSLKPAEYDMSRIDQTELKKHIERFITPYLYDKTLDRPEYIRTKTKTGRLSVVSGPNVLTMHSDLRKGIPGGHSIDFVSIEPNVLLVSQGKSPRTDIYDSIRKDVFNDSISRAKVKIATMAALYGSGRDDKFAKGIEEYFGVQETVRRLESEVKDEKIYNLYNRPIDLNGTRGKHLLALWLQSSAADAALLGFYNFCKDHDVIPHWIIHDGLIFIYDKNRSDVESLEVGLNHKLPVKVEKL